MQDDKPVFKIVEPPFCRDCQHYHWNACAFRRSDNCGSYLCCQPDEPVTDPGYESVFDNED